MATVEQAVSTRDIPLPQLWSAVPLLAAAGLLLGWTYFASLRRSLGVTLPSHRWLPYLLLAAVRIAAAALFFTFAARWGMPALLAAFLGFIAARQLAVRAGRPP